MIYYSRKGIEPNGLAVIAFLVFRCDFTRKVLLVVFERRRGH